MSDWSTLIPANKRHELQRLVKLLSQVAGMKAIVLGGSHARGSARPESDIDIGIYYSDTAPLDITAIKQIADEVSKKDTLPTVTQFYEWGAWVNGGAWIDTDTGKIDLLYRNVEQLERVIEDAEQGKIQWDFAQQPPYGFYSVTYLAETMSCKAIYDPEQLILKLKACTKKYPEPLRKSIIQENLWGAEFTLLHAQKSAKSKDIYSTAGCITRILSYLTQVLFALNRQYFISDKEALDSISTFSQRPDHYKDKVEDILTTPNSENLAHPVQKVELLFLSVRKLAKELYVSKYSL